MIASLVFVGKFSGKGKPENGLNPPTSSRPDGNPRPPPNVWCPDPHAPCGVPPPDAG